MNPIQILQGTPAWVFALFAVLAWLGARRLKPQTLPLARVWLVPAIFVIWGLAGLFGHRAAPWDTLAFWPLGAVLGAALGASLAVPLQVDRQHGLVRQPGSVVPLLRNLGFFGAHYVLQVAMAVRPDWRDRLLGWDLAVSGFSLGYFAAWSARFVQGLRRAPHSDLLVPAS
ncbi:DUF6622 family protein [Lysobacter silvisoli]|uniref:DUF1453 domain-containing protein n=1 Tax=Lysobacter silvisoli TaxID=2293254 RepID=A0A371JY65_9GAMM|nr:DUF6622 family protein [Lysobacter silvisoli]RDZ26605.1 hypothetical protein DX914_16620 [Lysobacter silvisoli]